MISRPSVRVESAVAVGVVMLLGAAFLWEVLSLAGVPIARDMQLFFVPQRRLLWAALSEGRLPLWTPLLGTGTPLLANFQSGAFYPPNWVYAVAPFFGAFNGLVAFHFLLGGASMYLFVREMGLRRGAACVGAAAYMLGGYFVSLTNLLNVLQVAAWAPMIAWITIRHLKSRSVPSLGGLVVVCWLAFMAGEPLTFALAFGLAAGYAAVWCWRHQSRRALLFLAVSLSLAGVLVAGLSALQVLPTAEFVFESDRAGGLSYPEAERYHLEPVRLANLFVPPEYGDPVFRFGRKALLVSVEPWLFSVYLGVVTLVLIAAARLDRGRRMEVLYWSVAGAFGLLLALGDATPVFGFLYRHLPGFSSFRFPERFLFLTGFSAAVLAAIGMSCLRAVRRPVRLDGFLGVMTLTFFVGARVAWSAFADPLKTWGADAFPEAPFFQNFEFAHALWAANLTRIAVLVAAALLIISLYRRGVFRESILVGGLLGLLALDLWTAHRQLTPVADPSFYENPPALAGVVPFEELRTEYRYRASPFGEDITLFHTLPGLSLESEKWMWQQTVQPNLGALQDILTHGSGDAIHLKRGVDQSTFLALLPTESRWRILRLASVRWIYSFHGFGPELYRERRALDSLPGFVYEMRDPLPRAYIAQEPLFFAEELEAFNATITRDFDPHDQVALLAGEAGGSGRPLRPGRAGAQGAPSRARIVSDTGTEVRIALSPSAEGYVVLTDSYYPGWTARVDGEERPILRANYSYRAVAVGPGDAEVVFTYSSRPLELGRRVSATTLVLCLVGFGLAGTLVRRRRAGAMAASG